MKGTRIFSIIIVCVAHLIKPHDAQSQIISTVVGTGTAGFSGDNGLASSANLNFPMGIRFDALGNLYIADYFNYRIRKVNTSGIITTVAGNGTGGDTGDGGQAINAEIAVEDIAFDTLGNFCFAGGNTIRYVNTSSGIISNIAGQPTHTFCAGNGFGGPATSACLFYTAAVIYDSLMNLYLSEGFTNYNYVARVDLSGIITQVAGTGSVTNSGDGGPATSAGLRGPEGLAIDDTGNIYIATNPLIRKINTSGIITSVVGTGVAGYSGDGGQATNAQICYPHGMIFDAAGNLFFADRGICNCVRKVDTAGIITTIAGNGTQGYSGDGGLAASAQLSQPWGIALDASGNLYISDAGNNRIRMVTNVAVGVNQLEDKNTRISIYPNPASDKIHLYNIPPDTELKMTLLNVSGQEIVIQKLNAGLLDVSDLSDGMYFLKVSYPNGMSVVKKVIKQ